MTAPIDSPAGSPVEGTAPAAIEALEAAVLAERDAARATCTAKGHAPAVVRDYWDAREADDMCSRCGVPLPEPEGPAVDPVQQARISLRELAQQAWAEADALETERLAMEEAFRVKERAAYVRARIAESKAQAAEKAAGGVE